MPQNQTPSSSNPVPDAQPGLPAKAQIYGLDIGGTKCAVGTLRKGRVEEIARFPTEEFELSFRKIVAAIAPMIGVGTAKPIFGISCGGPLDAKNGVIVSPPNLHPSWHGVAIAGRLTQHFGGRAFLMNDANACALAEWKFGAGRGACNMVFLTSGTGMGSGLILNGQLYEGTTGDAGEIGHVRLRADGPVGYGKAGSAEGFTSGGGIARRAAALIARTPGPKPVWAEAVDPITAKLIAEAARGGDALALEIMREAGEHFGEMLAILIDLFNPQRIVLGGFFPLCRDLLEPAIQMVLEREALPGPRAACAIVPSSLGETIGSHGAISVALHHSEAK